MRELVIDRSKWLRGEGSDASRLLRTSDGKMCCLGFYLRALGVSERTIADRPSPLSIRHAGDPLPDEAGWLLGMSGDSGWCRLLIETNDSEGMPEGDREADIAQDFLKAGVKVVFVG